MIAQSKPTRNADLRHAQSLGRQRRNAKHDPIGQAIAIASIARKCIDDGREFDAIYVKDLADDVWAELVCAATPNELRVIEEACSRREARMVAERAAREQCDAITDRRWAQIYPHLAA